ncbi:metallophosphoesterase family protein [Fundidesulfovibrio butyratiphilus]
MLFAVFSDIHANLEALLAAWTEMDRLCAPRERHVVCLGDMVGYGADPDAVVDFLREKQVLAILGNHEFGLLRPGFRRSFNPISLQALEWTAQRIRPSTRDWIASLPLSLSLAGCRFVHGFPPNNPSVYLHEVSPARLERTMLSLDETVSFVGHTHLLRRITLRDGKLERSRLDTGPILLEPDARHLINAGAVGQPRDADPRATFLLYESATGRLDVVRTVYDWHAAATKIRATGIPDVYADRLEPDRP